MPTTYYPLWIDGITIKNGVSFQDTTEVTSTGTISVTDNSLIEAGDTITISKKDDRQLLVLNFDGADGATTWVEEAQGLTPITNEGMSVDTATARFGVSSLLAANTADPLYPELEYQWSPASGDSTFHCFIKVDTLSWAPPDGPGDSNPHNHYFQFTLRDTDWNWYLYISWQFIASLWFQVEGYIHPDGDFINDATLNSALTQPLTAGSFVHLAVVSHGSEVYIFLGGTKIATYTVPTGQALLNISSLNYEVYRESDDFKLWIDAVEMVNYAKWTSNFTPPVQAPSTDNLPITTYTFVTTPTGAPNQIVIGPDASTTATNIAVVINATYGAMFTATSADGVVTVTAYTSDDITITDTSDGILTGGGAAKSITYNTSQASATLPSFTSYAEGDAFGDLGSIYGLSTIAPFVCSGAASQSGIAGSGTMAAFTGTGNIFLRSCTIASTEADITALLKYDETWMKAFAAMVVVPGDDDDAALVATQWVAANLTPLSDLSGWGVADHWAEPRETLYWGQGDNEDGAFLLASILVNSGIPISRVRVYIGTLGGVDHKWVAYYRSSDSNWVFLDWTNGSTYWNSKSALSELPKAIDLVSQYDSASYYVTAYA